MSELPSSLTASTNPQTPPRRTPKPWIVWVLFSVALLVFVSAFFIDVPFFKRAAIPTQNNVPVPNGNYVPEFSLTERSGKTITNQNLLGKVWVASFVFTRCSGPCPTVTATMKKLQDDLKANNWLDVHLVTFTVDPERDQLEDLKEYAHRFRADPERWYFLTGPEEQIRPLINQGFKVLAEKSTTQNPKPGEEFDHSTRLVVVNKQGRITHYFDGQKGEHSSEENFRQQQEKLRSVIGQLRQE